jgi:hypothetical protein
MYEMSQFVSLRDRLAAMASSELARVAPEYVQTFQAQFKETGGDLAEVLKRTAHLCKQCLPADWRGLLTSTFDFEYGVLNTNQSYDLVREAADAPDGARSLFAYHQGTWLQSVGNLTERAETMLTKCVRTTIPSEKRPALLKQLIGDVTDLKTESKLWDRRNELVHGLGGGISRIAEQWDAYLATPDAVQNIRVLASSTFEGVQTDIVRDSRQRMLATLTTVTSAILFGLDEVCGKMLAAM